MAARPCVLYSRPMALRGDIVPRLVELVGPEHVAGDTVFPGTAEEVAAVLALANTEHLRVIPAGGSTQQELGAAPGGSDLTVCLRRLNHLKQYEPADLTASMGAGLTMAELSAALAPHRQWLPLGVACPERATIGGALATNSSGPFRLFYGTARDMVIGMHFATVEGKVVKSGGMVVKNVAGYDMAKLMIGSLGTLAVITDVTLKLFPRPATETSVLVFGSLAHALESRGAILRSVLSPLALDLLDGGAASLVGQAAARQLPRGEFLLAVAYGGVERVIERSRGEVATLGRDAGATDSATLAGEQEHHLWQAVCDLPATFSAAHPHSARLKLSSTLLGMQPLLETAIGDLRRQGAETALVARAGSGVSYLYVCGLSVSGADLLGFCRNTQRVALSLGAHVVIEFAPPPIQAQLDVWGPPRDDYAIMQKLKQSFDPKGILNPGRFVC